MPTIVRVTPVMTASHTWKRSPCRCSLRDTEGAYGKALLQHATGITFRSPLLGMSYSALRPRRQYTITLWGRPNRGRRWNGQASWLGDVLLRKI
jgi:hypothetical protein